MELVALGAALGFCLIAGGIGFAGSYRAWLTAGDTKGVRAQLLFLAAAIATHALVFGVGGYGGGFVAPIGIALGVGAFVFGIGMQMASGCGSGTLAALGAGSARMRVVLPFFVAGAFWGSLDAPAWDALPAFSPLSLGDEWGWSVSTAIQLLFVAVLWRILPKAAALPHRTVAAALALAVFAAACVPLAGHPWGITSAFALGGAKIAQMLGWDPALSAAWSHGWQAQALADPWWHNTTARLDMGLVLGAFAAARIVPPRPSFATPDLRGWTFASLGGLLMGYGARISGGCNIGAFVGGVVSGSPHGWAWIVAALAGCHVGIKLTSARR
jgi:uncharacterized protein